MSTETTTTTESNSARKRRLAAEHNAARAAPTCHTTINEITRAEREELNGLSKEVFGASSRWQRLVTKGYRKLVTTKETQVVPGAKEGDAPTLQETDVPAKIGNNSFLFTTERYDLAGIRAYMTERKVQLDLFRAEIKRQQDELKKKKEQEQHAQKVHQELQGSAV